MKYICLGYTEPGKWESMSEAERNSMMEECFAYDDVLRKNGHFAGGEALQAPGSAVNPAVAEWKGGGHRRPLRRNQGADRRHSDSRSQGFEPCDPIDVEAPGRASGWAIRDSPGRRGDQRTDHRKRPGRSTVSTLGKMRRQH